MITLSDAARQELEAYFTDKERSPIRVFLASGGCQGQRLALALDAPGEADVVFPEENGFTLCMEQALFDATGNVTIDMNYMGFTVDSENPVGGGGGCASCGGGCAG